jgi:tRNA wybutosine-synthesizing protein 1
VFGCGNKLYGDNFNAVARKVDQGLAAMGGHAVVPLGLGNEDSNDMESQFDEWSVNLIAALQELQAGELGDSGNQQLLN